MDRIINVKVAGSHLTKDSKNAGTRGEANITNLRITFDGGWNDDFDKKIIFLDARGLNPVVIHLLPNLAESETTYLVPIPKEPMAIAGELTFVIEGTKGKMVQKSLADTLVVKDSPDTSNAEKPVEPTEDELAQLRHGIEEIKGNILTAVDAKEDAEGFAKDAEKYSQQALTAVGKASYIGEDGYWYAWDTEKQEYYFTNVKAQAGASVYMGDNPPDDADIWIDPNGKAPKVGADMAENNENHPRYIENRTHYVEGKLYGELHFTKEETAVGESDGYMTITLSEPLEFGKEYPYETDKGSGTLVLAQYGDVVYTDVMGYNMNYLDDGSTHKFVVAIGYDVEGYIIIGQKPIYHPLADGFIPEGIARKAYVDEVVKRLVEELKSKAVVKKTTITLYEAAWDGDNGEYTQIVDMLKDKVTPNSQVDLQITDEQMKIFKGKDISFTVKNVGGTVTVKCYGVKPSQDYDVQVSIMEVEFI